MKKPIKPNVPYKPSVPEEYHVQNTIVNSIYGEISIGEWLTNNGIDHQVIDLNQLKISCDPYDEGCMEISYPKTTRLYNTDYPRQLKAYEKKLVKYNQRMASLVEPLRIYEEEMVVYNQFLKEEEKKKEEKRLDEMEKILRKAGRLKAQGYRENY